MWGCVTAIRRTVRILGLLTMAVMLIPGSATLAAGTVNVLYAGSLVSLMEHGLAAQMPRVTGDASRVPVQALVEMAK